MMIDFLEIRFKTKYPLTFYQRLTYPFFIIKILNSFSTPEAGKSDFLEKFVKPYLNDSSFRQYVSNKYIVFFRDDYIGVMNDKESEEYSLDNFKNAKYRNDPLVCFINKSFAHSENENNKFFLF